jgi:hypothetical protein
MPKSDLDTALERDPLTFMKTHSVLPQDYTGHNPGIFNKANSATPGGAAVDETLVIERRARQIAYTKLAQVVDKQNNEVQANTYNLFFETGDRIGTAAADTIACWFLPWASNHLTTFQLPPKIPPKPGAAAAKTSLDPDLFFTAAISGCSVMVAGDPKSPIVTHGGTASSRSKLTDENAFTAWSFYLQKTVTFTFTRLRKKKGTLSTSYVPAVVPSRKGLAPGEKATMIEDQKTASVTITVVRFFPGNGKAAASALLPPSQVKAILESYL